MQSWMVPTGVKTRVAAAQRRAVLSPRAPLAGVAAPATRIASLTPVPNGSTTRPLWAGRTKFAALSLPGKHGESLRRRASPTNCGRRGRRSYHGCPLVPERATLPRYCIGRPGLAYWLPRKILQEEAEHDPAPAVDCGLLCRSELTVAYSK